ncbi:hypothetical protein [Seonamhaeicola marinus]|uniref:HTH luxR-type domain-containing protein n=1 Tax=Seonamhaeicola marinus TaxID=1912246 RepID=A0A5D0HKZ1_9FLAO|nr:hypothetical protein [Seonamhaeicola marinus]TYA71640.1 hypothetical protein FUA24_18920 [Seonamhaeicola marinus]
MVNSLNNNTLLKALFVICLLLVFKGNGQVDYRRFVDSANNHIDESSLKALQFLDSIPEPVEKHIEGKLGEYYSNKALIYDDFNEYSKIYQSYILALKYADKEESYFIAGETCVNLFSILSHSKKDSIANIYLEKAKKYYELDGFEYGDFEIELSKAYDAVVKGYHKRSNGLIFKRLEDYKKVVDKDAYYYMFALHLITSNYLYIEDLENAHKYFSKFKILKANNTVAAFNYYSFEATLKANFAEVHFKKKQLDSSKYYLKEAKKRRKFMESETLKDYYTLNVDVLLEEKEIESARLYLDSLKIFQRKLLNSVIDTGNDINVELLNTEHELGEVTKERTFFGYFGIILLSTLLAVSLIYFIFYYKQRVKLSKLDIQNKNLTHLKTNHEKLTAKVQGLEDYITTLKGKVKYISSINDVDTQKDMIKDFYKNLHLGSSTILEESNSHFDLVNDFNISFFNKLKNLYPKLNDSEIIICYYIYIGFKNKEIALFLNTSVRAIESKRYRITKKIDFDKQEMTLVDFLKNTFIDE